MSDGEFSYAWKWVAFVIAVMLLLTAIGYVLMPVSKMVERKVLVESHQYKEGMADRRATLEASLAEIDSRLARGVDEQTRNDLEAQRSTINVQLNSMRR